VTTKQVADAVPQTTVVHEVDGELLQVARRAVRVYGHDIARMPNAAQRRVGLTRASTASVNPSGEASSETAGQGTPCWRCSRIRESARTPVPESG